MSGKQIERSQQSPRRVVGKGLLAVVTLLMMASQGGGFLLLPTLMPLHVWAARTSGPAGRVLWSLGPVIAVGMVSWALVYVTLGEAKPAIWALPTLASVGAAVAVGHLSRPSPFATTPAHV